MLELEKNKDNIEKLVFSEVLLPGVLLSGHLVILAILVSALLRSYRRQLVRHSRYDLGEAFWSSWGCIWVVLKWFKMAFV